MNECQQAMIAEARQLHGEIRPCATRQKIEDCFADHGKYGFFLYFNTPDGNTHVIRKQNLADTSGHSQDGDGVSTSLPAPRPSLEETE